MNKPGFTLVEVLLASAIAVILTGLLFMVVRQLNSSIPIIDRRADVYEKAAILNAQLERDFSGIIAPNEFYARQKTKAQDKQESSAEQKTLRQAQDDRGEEKKKKESQEESLSQEAPKKPLEKLFYSMNKDGMLDQISFITVNPLQVYWGKTASAKPRIARVVYSVQEEKNSRKNAKRSYRLVRQESPLLDWDQFKSDASIAEYTVADNIKSITVEFSAITVPQENTQGQSADEQKASKKEIEKKKDWTEKVQEQTDAAKKLPLAPQLAQFDVVFWDQNQQRSIPFSFAIPIPAQLEEKRSEGPALLQKLRTLVGQKPVNTEPQSNNAQPSTIFARQQRPVPTFNFSQPRLRP